MIYIALIIGCLLLYKGGDWLLDAMLAIGDRLSLPKAIVGLVLVSLGTSAPELFVSVGSALQNHGGMAVGNVVGSNIINIAIVLGIAVVLAGLPIERRLHNQILATALLSVIALWFISDGEVTRIEGGALMLFMLATMAVALKSNPLDQQVDEALNEQPTGANGSTKALPLLLGGLATLLIGAEAMIWGGLGLAKQFGLSETVIALTVTALGTSLPEIATSVVAMLRRETSLALGNVVGSNILNIGLVLGFSAVVMPLAPVSLDVLTQMYFVGLVLLLLLFSLTYQRLPRLLGYVFMLIYASYVVLILR